MGRLGIVGYLNARPLTDDLDRTNHEIVADHPAGIARALLAGEVDLALAPVATVLQDPELRIVPGWCIGSTGPVASVLLVAEVEPERWTRVVLDGVSRTSKVLARLLLAGPLAARLPPGLVIEEGPAGCALEVAAGTTAALVIGDVARRLPERLGVRLDLAELWRAWTGLPFVFAVWAGRPDVPVSLREEVRRAGERGVASIPDRFEGDDLDYLAVRLRYPLDDRAMMGLRRFAALGARAGLLAVGDPALYPPAVVHAPRGDWMPLLERAVDGEPLADAEIRVLSTAPIAELGAAADLRRADPDSATARTAGGWDVGEDLDGVFLGGGADPVGDLIALVHRHRETGRPQVVRCAAGTREALHLAALARLVGGFRRVEAADDGSGVSGVGLLMGCDPVPERSPAVAPLPAVERQASLR